MAPRFGHSDDIEARFCRQALELERSGLSFQRIKPNRRSPFGHRHQAQEEIYVLVGGSARVKLDDDVHELRPMDAVRVSPQTARAFEAGPDGAELIIFGSGEGGVSDAEMLPHWWSD
ncbi:MAG: cupin domain-containing protein [Solirubrobacterales bacterium]